MASFSSTPSTILFTSGPWHTSNGRYYTRHASSETSQYVRYELTASDGSILSTVHGISFTATSSGITLDVNDGVPGSNEPANFSGAGYTNVGSGTVSAGNSIDLYNPHGTASSNISAVFTVPSLGYSSGGGTSTEEVLVENASMVFYVGVTGWRFEQRGYAAGAYSLVGGTVNESWTVSNASNNLQHHISQIPAGGTYYLYSGSNLAATLVTTSNKKVFCNFW